MAYNEPTFRRHGAKDSTDNSFGGLTTGDYRGRRRDKPQHEKPESAIKTDESAARVVAAVHSIGTGRAASAGPDGTDNLMATTVDDRDRFAIHFGWEVILLLGVAALGYLLYRLDPASLLRPALDTLLVSATAIGLLTLGAGLTLRAGVPNLAVGPIAVASALHFAENGDRGLVPAALPAIGIAAAGGLVVAVLVVALHVPGWAATLAGAMGVIVFNELRNSPVDVQGGYDPSNQAFLLFGGFAVLAVLGGGLGTVTPVRRMLGWGRPTGDPALRGRPTAALPIVVSLVVSSALAVLAGVLLAANSATAIKPGTGIEWTGLAVGLALVAGTSVFGRRGGIFGTLLAVTGMALFLDYADRRNLNIAVYAIAGSVLVAGLVVSRLIETYGAPSRQGVGEDWHQPPANENWTPAAPDSWTPTVPTQSPPDRWLDDRWGQTPR
jgi:ribose/xylose/arabinose/galactoside ABC-type transport system permease subunit